MFDNILGLTMPWALKSEALEYSEKYGYPISPDVLTGRLNEQGQGDARDAFRHLYGTAVLAYEGGITPARDIAEWGETFGGNPDFLANMDRVNNAIAIDIARKVRAKFVGNPSVTEQQVKDEIAREANEAIVSGKATFYITRDNDHDYTPPSGVLDPANDVGEGESHFPVGGGASNDNSAPASAGSSGGLLSSITDFFSSTADRIGGALGLGGGRSGAALALNGRFGFQRVGLDPGSLERLLSQGIDKFTDKVAERLVKNDGVLNNALGRTLTQNTGVFGDLLRKGRMGELGGALEDVFSAGNIGKVIGDFAGNAINAGFNKLVGAGKVKTTVTSQESERSREAQSRWNPSRSQQAAELARVVNMGTRNL